MLKLRMPRNRYIVVCFVLAPNACHNDKLNRHLWSKPKKTVQSMFCECG